MLIAEILISVALFGAIVHAYWSGWQVTRGEPIPNKIVATVVIFFSSLWLIGPLTYLGFRRKSPLLARACLRQMVVFTVAWLAVRAVESLVENW